MPFNFRWPLRAGFLPVFLLVWGVPPVLAVERVGDVPFAKTAVDVTVAKDVFAPTATVPSALFETQMPQRPLIGPPSRDNGVLENPTLRRSLIVSFAALQALDGHSTMKALARGGRETNPMMSGIAGNRGALFAAKAGTALATAYLAERLSKKHPKRAVVLMAVLNSAYVAIVAHNYRVARGGR